MLFGLKDESTCEFWVDGAQGKEEEVVIRNVIGITFELAEWHTRNEEPGDSTGTLAFVTSLYLHKNSRAKSRPWVDN